MDSEDRHPVIPPPDVPRAGRWPLPPPPPRVDRESRGAVGSGDGQALGGRLHPATIGVAAFGQLLPLVVVLFAGPFALPMVGVAGAIAIGVSALTWWRFTWRVEDNALVIEQGLLQRRRRVIPINRIQSVESVRKLRHRVFGVVALRVESVGAEDSEGQLDALDPGLAERLRAVLLGAASEGALAERPQPAADGDLLVHLGPWQLVVAGLTGGRVGVAAAILGLGQDLWFDRLAEADVFDRVLVDQATRNIALIAVAVLAGVVVVFLVSVIATAVTFWDFTLTRDGSTLGVRRGLLEQRSDTIPLTRIQAVRIEQNLLRRLFGLAAVKIEVAGRAGSANQQRQTDVVLPAGPMPEARQLANEILGAAVAGTRLEPMPPAARTRRLVRAGAGTVVACLPAVVEPLALVAGVVIVPFALLAIADYRALGWAVTEDHVLARRGVFLRRLWLVPTTAVQSVAASSTPFQRGRDLASLTLHIARSSNAGNPALIDLADADVVALCERLAAASTAAGRRQVRERRARIRGVSAAPAPEMG